MRCAFMSSRPSSNTANRPTGPAPMMSASVLITSVLVSTAGIPFRYLSELGHCLYGRLSSGRNVAGKAKMQATAAAHVTSCLTWPIAYGKTGDSALNDQPSAKPARVLPRLEQFPGRTGDMIRFGDLDPQGHVNNTVFATYFETGRVMLLREPRQRAQSARRDLGAGAARHQFSAGAALAGHGRDRHRHASRSAARPTRSCRRSSTTAHAPRPARATMVMIDAATRRARPLPEEVVARLEELAYEYDE